MKTRAIDFQSLENRKQDLRNRSALGFRNWPSGVFVNGAHGACARVYETRKTIAASGGQRLVRPAGAPTKKLQNSFCRTAESILDFRKKNRPDQLRAAGTAASQPAKASAVRREDGRRDRDDRQGRR